MNLNEQFKLKFNELDQICKSMYPDCSRGFDAIRKFANSLEGNNKTKLLNIIKLRNINTHEDTNIMSFNKEAIKFLQGLIDGAKRISNNVSTIKIDSNTENLRTKNLREMNSRLKYIINKYNFLDKIYLDEIKNDLTFYINKAQKANNIEMIKQCYFDFVSYIHSIESKASVKKTRMIIKNAKLEKAKNSAINDIESLYANVINNTSIFNIIIRNRVKTLRISAIESIERSTSFDELHDIIEEYEDIFDDIIYELEDY